MMLLMRCLPRRAGRKDTSFGREPGLRGARRPTATVARSELPAHPERRFNGAERVVEPVDHLVEIAIARLGTDDQVLRREVFRADSGVEREAVVVRNRYSLRAYRARDAVVQIGRR